MARYQVGNVKTKRIEPYEEYQYGIKITMTLGRKLNDIEFQNLKEDILQALIKKGWKEPEVAYQRFDDATKTLELHIMGGKKPFEQLDLFTRMEKMKDWCIANYKHKIPEILDKMKVTNDYARKELTEILEWILKEFDMWISNEDWNFYKERGIVKQEYAHALITIRDSAYYWVDEAWGFEAMEPSAKRPEIAERIALSLMEPLRREREAFFRSMPEKFRFEERNKARETVRLFLFSLDKCMMSKIPELR
jgi:hypothetical protein